MNEAQEGREKEDEESREDERQKWEELRREQGWEERGRGEKQLELSWWTTALPEAKCKGTKYNEVESAES